MHQCAHDHLLLFLVSSQSWSLPEWQIPLEIRGNSVLIKLVRLSQLNWKRRVILRGL